jgi:hypothetical protein
MSWEQIAFCILVPILMASPWVLGLFVYGFILVLQKMGLESDPNDQRAHAPCSRSGDG